MGPNFDIFLYEQFEEWCEERGLDSAWEDYYEWRDNMRDDYDSERN